jgi:hypothetical protein
MSRFRALRVLTLSTFLAFAATLTGAAAPRADAATSPIGAHSMLQVSSPPQFMQAMFAEAAAMHASSIRLDVQPSIVFASPSRPPDFSGLDEVMALSQQYHLRVVADLLSLPPWIANCQHPWGDPARCGTDDLTDYGSVISQIVAHAEPVIRDWEIWNEPDGPSFFSGTPEQYAQMLRTAHDAIKQIDPQANVLLGGISGTSGMNWLAQVFLTPGADAAHAFDIANIHERGHLGQLAADVSAWRQYFAKFQFGGPLWVTEHGYPADSAFQYDPAYAGGAPSQASFLTASIPTMIDAGASAVFITERDNLGGQFASEGLLGGNVLDPPTDAPQVTEKPAYAAVAGLSSCYVLLSRDCPGPGPSASPSTLAVAPATVGSTSASMVSITNPGSEPLPIGAVSLTTGELAVTADGCSAQILEPAQSCVVKVRFAPTAPGAAQATLTVPTDNGTLGVPVSALAPSVADLAWTPPAFEATGAHSHAGQVQRLVLALRNPLTSQVSLGASTLDQAKDAGFVVKANRCHWARLTPGATCRVSVLFRPTGPRVARATLTLRGGGAEVKIGLWAGPFAPPAVRQVSAPKCLTRAVRISVRTDAPATVRWHILRWTADLVPACGRHGVRAEASTTGRSSAAGRARTTGATHGALGRFALPRGLKPGTYVLSVVASNAHGTGERQTLLLTVP